MPQHLGCLFSWVHVSFIFISWFKVQGRSMETGEGRLLPETLLGPAGNRGEGEECIPLTVRYHATQRWSWRCMVQVQLPQVHGACTAISEAKTES